MSVDVLFVSSHSRLGGSERYLADLVSNVGEGWVAGVVALEEGPAVDRLRAAGISVDVVPCGRSVWSMLRAAVRLWRLVARYSPAVLHANGIKAAAVCAAMPTRKPIVWVKHDFSWDGRLARWVARRCERVVGVSRAVLSGLGDRSDDVVIHPGLPLVQADVEAGRVEFAKAVGDIADIVLLVGRTHPVKGHRDLIETAPAITNRVPAARIVFVGGDDPDHPDHVEKLRRLTTEAGEDRIVWLGERSDALDLIAAATLLVVPTGGDPAAPQGEGFGYTALEAMAVGTPVAGYSHGGLPEVTGSCAALVRPGARDDLAEAIISLLLDAAGRERAAACGRRRARSEFSMERCVDQMRAVYSAAAR